MSVQFLPFRLRSSSGNTIERPVTPDTSEFELKVLKSGTKVILTIDDQNQWDCEKPIIINSPPPDVVVALVLEVDGQIQTDLIQSSSAPWDGAVVLVLEVDDTKKKLTISCNYRIESVCSFEFTMQMFSGFSGSKNFCSGTKPYRIDPQLILEPDGGSDHQTRFCDSYSRA